MLATDRPSLMTDEQPRRRHSRVRRKALASCKEGTHRFGSGSHIGGGILRRICDACGAISIDLTAAEDSRVGARFRSRAQLGLPDEA